MPNSWNDRLGTRAWLAVLQTSCSGRRVALVLPYGDTEPNPRVSGSPAARGTKSWNRTNATPALSLGWHLIVAAAACGAGRGHPVVDTHVVIPWPGSSPSNVCHPPVASRGRSRSRMASPPRGIEATQKSAALNASRADCGEPV